MLTIVKTVSELENIKKSLSDGDRNLFERYFRVDTTVGKLNAPEAMHGWIEKNFGSLEKVETQKIVKSLI